MAIVKMHASPQMKDECERVGLLPALGQRRREVETGIAGNQAVKE